MAESVDAGTWPLVEAVCAPVRADSPCGDDVTYDDDYQRMKEMVDGLSSAGSDEVDFSVLVDAGRTLLTTRSKDIRAAVFLAFGLERTRGAAGLAEGLAVVDALLQTHWDCMYPPRSRMAGRQNALQALSDRLKEWIAGVSYAPDARPHLEAAQASLKSLQQFTLDTMEDRAPALSGLGQAIQEALRRLPSAAGEAAAPAGTAPGGQRAPSPPDGTARAAAAPASAAGAFETQNDAIRAVERAAEFLRGNDPAGPLAYVLLRDLRWSRLAEAPPNESGKTLIPPPPRPRLEAMENLAAAANHQVLLGAAEDLFAEFPLALDAQRYVVFAMEGLGAPMQRARSAVLAAVAVLLRRVEALPDLAFNDGTPLADDATRGWIETRVRPMFGSSEQSAPASRGGASPLDDVFAAAREELAGGDLKRALAAMQQGAEKDDGARERFRRRLLGARLCMTARQFALARPMLDGLDAEIERFGLTEWEPALALETWTNLHRCLQEIARAAAGPEQPALKQQVDRAFDKICRLDASHALSIMGKSKR